MQQLITKQLNILLTLVLSFICFTIQAQTVHPSYWDGQVYVKVKETSNKVFPDFNRSKTTKAGIENYPYLSKQLESYQVQTLNRPFKALKTPVFDRTYRIDFKNVQEIDAFMEELEQLEHIEYVEKVPINYTNAIPNDPGVSYQWHLDAVDAYDAWDLISPGQKIRVAIVDDAVRLNHEDLADNIWRNLPEINGTNGVDDDGNGYIDDYHGWDGANWNNNPNPPSNATDQHFMHGTHVAGIAGAVTNNNRGVATLSYNNIEIVACKGGRDSDGGLLGIWDAFAYALSTNSDIISNSWGRGYVNGTPPPPLAAFEKALLNEAYQKGMIVLFAAGNETANLAYPAAYEKVIAVAASGNQHTGAYDEKAGYSNYGSWVDITAPGSSILSTSPGYQGYVAIPGTSMACPLVASLLALMKSQAPHLSNQQLVNCLYSSADNIDAQNPNYVGLLGAGRINARKAIQCVKSGGGATCSTPTGLAVNDLTAETTTLVWSSVNGANGYNVEIRTQGNSSWYSFENNPFSNNSLPIVGMTPSTTYEFRVQAVCGNVNGSFSNPFVFTTQSSSGGGGGNPEYCLSANDAYDSLIEGGDCDNGIVEAPWEVWNGEAYVVAQCMPSQTYIFSICDGYSASNWEAELTAVEILEDGSDFGAVFGNIVGCELIFTIPAHYSSPVNIALIVADHNNCGGATEEIDNGIPKFGCHEGGGGNACIFANSIYDDLAEGGNCDNGIIEAPWEVWTNEAYFVEQCQPGQEYIFSICEGYDSGTWEAELTAAEVTSEATLGAIFGNVIGCELVFTIPNSYNSPTDIILIVADHNDCGGATIETDNGIPSFGCQGATATCSIPTGLGVSNVQSNEALLIWSEVNEASTYNVQARQKGTTEWLEGIGIEDTDARYTGLSPCTDYEFRVQSVCGGGNQSEYSSILSFKSEGCAPPCPTPSNVNLSNITAESARISWNGNGNADNYLINYRTAGTITWQSVESEQTNITLQNLVSCLTYEVQVISVCNDTGSEASNILTFETTCVPCTSPSNIETVAVTPTNATILWEQHPLALSYTLRASDAGANDWISGDFDEIGVFYSGLEPCQSYEVQLKSICSDGESDFSSSHVFTTSGCGGISYCTSQGEVADYEWIESVRVGDFFHSSGNDYGYVVFDDFQPVFETDKNYNVTLIPGFSDDPFEEYWRIWIDLNQDGDFNDIGEMVFDSESPQTSSISGNLKIPNSAIGGKTTMRVAMKWIEPSTDASLPDPCLTFGYGEVEDYTIQIINVVSIEEEAVPILLTLSPNPNNGTFQLSADLDRFQKLQIRISDMFGRTIDTRQLEANRIEETIDLPNITSGMYFLSVETENETQTLPVVVK